MDIADRLNLFFAELRDAPAAANIEEALELLSRILDDIEDRFSGVAKNPNPGFSFDGRMYPPFMDQIEDLPGGGKLATTRGHNIYISSQGGIVIEHRSSGELMLQKEGKGR